MRAASSIPTSASQDAWVPGTRVKTGVTMPNFIAYLFGMSARSAMMFFCTSVAPAPIDV